ncbi:gamma-aminobutyric acid receptor alpha-like isoform X1 [Brachionus plicatilis]|uniref:Gamma-aminobutyric acid receptor alpha-like isoform X1 n=1 Tax=Brachionus plicatilis TaxID=10195 RepID=A0A3M7PG24_BRAPC|nr:gamma-aminobutyric acid receptor alpha-like isoform X1 [Brachionus plicatilis]
MHGGLLLCEENVHITINITRVLDKLLTNYRIPTVIDTNMNINSLGPISNFEMSYTMDCYFRQGSKNK